MTQACFTSSPVKSEMDRLEKDLSLLRSLVYSWHLDLMNFKEEITKLKDKVMDKQIKKIEKGVKKSEVQLKSLERMDKKQDKKMASCDKMKKKR